MKKMTKKKTVLIVVLCLAAALLIADVVLMISKLEKKSEQADAPLTIEQKEPVTKTEEKPQPELVFVSQKIADAVEKNGDVVGWLTLKGCEIDNMVFQADDNDYYLRKNESGEYDVWGCYFLDYMNVNDGSTLPDRVSIIYGHSLDDYSESEKFSKLKRYKVASFAADNPVISFSLLYDELEYRVFAACDIPVSIDYIDPNPDDEKYQSTLDYMLKNSYVDFGESVTTNDKILVLSTCTSDENVRFVVAAKLAKQ